jgi:hypothetical protein
MLETAVVESTVGCEEENMENEIEYMRDHPPRCLDGLCRPAPDELLSFLQKQFGADSTVFTPVCECSQEFVTVSSSEGFSPTSISCSQCGKGRVVFDPTQHGYDGELGHNADTEMATAEPVICSKCGGEHLRLALCFQYSGETDVLEDEDPPDVKPEDLFGWVMIAGQCAKCQAIQEVCQGECA